MGRVRAHGASLDEEPLSRVVARQRQENLGLRAALRHRAVIEQAKGILMARSGLDPEAAFHRLVAHSQRTNLKVTKVAAAVVAQSMTNRPAGGALTDDEILEVATGEGAQQRLIAAAVTAAPDFTELLETVVEHTHQLGVGAGMLALAEPDGALRLVAWHGVDAFAASGWQRIPPGADLPACAAAESRRPVWLHDRDERRRAFPGSERFPGHRDGCAVFPLVFERQLIGCLGLEWDGPCILDERDREHLVEVAGLCAGPVASLLRRHEDPLPALESEPGYSRWFRAYLDTLPTPILLLEPDVRDQGFTDLTVVFANRAADGWPRLASGSRLLETMPELAGSEFLAAVDEVVRSGEPARVPRLELGPPEGPTVHFVEVNLARLGSLLSLSWRD